MMNPCYEIVVYDVRDTADADRERILAMECVKMLPGFLSWIPLTSINEESQRTDLVTWATLDDALNTAHLVGNAPQFSNFRATVSRVVTMGHYSTSSKQPLVPTQSYGVEIARFRLKTGVDEQRMRAAYAAMVASHLRAQPGWQGHHLVSLQDGVFVDLTFADTEKRAIEICESWPGNPDCDVFLSMIKLVSMEFGNAMIDMTAA